MIIAYFICILIMSISSLKLFGYVSITSTIIIFTFLLSLTIYNTNFILFDN